MATKEQYEFFKLLYDVEEQRYGQLESRARFYFGGVSIFIAGILLKAPEVKASVAALGGAWPLMLLGALLLAVTLVLIGIGTHIRTYEGIADGGSVVKAYGEKPPTNEDFFDDRIADLVVATARNSQVNNRVARVLAGAGYCLSLAFVALLAVVAFALWKETGPH